MEKNAVHFLLVVSLMVGLLVGQSAASGNDICYKQCHSKCSSIHSRDVKACVKTCLKACNTPSSFETLNVKNTQDFCKLGCVSSLCADLSTEENPGDVEKLKVCVGYCSETCTKNN